MSTKRNPTRYDAYVRAGEDEPVFTLRGKDTLAAGMVDLWIALRLHQFARAAKAFADLVRAAQLRAPEQRQPKIDEAELCREHLLAWQDLESMVREICRPEAAPQRSHES